MSMKDVPFIGHDDIHYEFENGNKFMSEKKFYGSFDEWIDEQIGYCFRREIIADAVEDKNIEEVIKFLGHAWCLGCQLGREECAAFGCDNNLEYDV